MNVDKYGTEVLVGDYVCYATGSQIWVGRVTAIPEYIGDYETLVKIQINAELGDDKYGKRTFDFVSDKIYRIGR